LTRQYLLFDGVKILEVPFNRFKQDSSGDYEYRYKNINAEIDFSRGKIELSGNNIQTRGVDNTNGIDIEVDFGPATGTDHFDMTYDNDHGRSNRHDRDNHDSDLSHKEQRRDDDHSGHH